MVDRPAVTLAAIARRRTEPLEHLVSRFVELAAAHDGEVVIAVETPGVTAPAEKPDARGVRWIEIPEHHGLGYNRNRVVEAARGDVLAWADDDCVPDAGWLDALLGALGDPSIAAAAGAIEIPPSGFVGDSISALGFPAGGRAGYATMFTVHDDGTTENLPSGNSAIRTAVLRDVGAFDESMTWGGEDTELSHRLRESGHRIAFVPSAVLTHPARTSVGEFCSWSYRRGRAKKQFARKVAIGGYVGKRLSSYGRILRDNARDAKIVLIAPLLLANLVLQQAGFIAEAIRPTRAPGETVS